MGHVLGSDPKKSAQGEDAGRTDLDQMLHNANKSRVTFRSLQAMDRCSGIRQAEIGHLALGPADLAQAKEALDLGAAKLQFKTRVISRGGE